LAKQSKKETYRYKGGKCEKCGYNKCDRALDFHHDDPNKKDFSVSSNGWSFERRKKEVDKCSLLCSNCHREVHDKLVFERRKEREKLQRKFLKKKICVHCKKKFKPRKIEQKYCSIKCRSLFSYGIEGERPNKEQLKKEIETMSWCAIGRKYGVSDNAVRKWAKKHKLIK